MSDDPRKWKIITGIKKLLIEEMNSDNRPWVVMTGNELWWQEMKGDEKN